MLLLWIPTCIAIACVALYMRSKSFRFFVSVMTFPVVTVIASAIFLPWGLLFPDTKVLRNMAALVRFARPLIGIDFEMEGCENIQNKPHVIVINHRSHLDCLAILNKYHWFHPCVPVFKKEAKHFSLTFGWLNSLCGAVFLDRDRSDEAKKELQKTLEFLKANKCSIVICPEGTRNYTQEPLLPFKKGAFHMAISAKMPILPIVLSDYSSFYSKKERKFNRGRIIMKVLPEIPTDNLTAADVDELCKKTFELMKKVKEECKPVLIS